MYKTSWLLCEDMNVLFKCLIIFSLAFSASVAAVEVEDLFETEVFANSQSKKDGNTALREALSIVLARVMVGDNILQDPTVQAALADAHHYTKEYQYSLTENAMTKATSARVMRVRFKEAELLELMRSSRLGIWSEMRPEVLVWLVVEEDGKRQFFKSAEMPELDNALSLAAKRKKVPLIFPMLDLEEQQKIAVGDVLSAYPGRLLKASERYDVPAILAGRVVKKQDCWRAEWAFHFNREIKQWTHGCADLNTVVLSGVRGAYSQLSVYYGIKPELAAMGMVLIGISEVSSIRDMNRVMAHLKSLKAVKMVSWEQLENGMNFYKLEGNI